jgi:hypothetical protein
MQTTTAAAKPHIEKAATARKTAAAMRLRKKTNDRKINQG